MTTDELDRLDALATAVDDAYWFNLDYLGAFIDGDDERAFPAADAAFIAACDPDTIRRLVAAAREPLDVERLAIALCANRPPTPAADIDMFVDDECRTLARTIAAEYVALRKPVTA